MNRPPLRERDRDLMMRYLNDPASHEGQSAKEELEFRKYLAFARYNKWLIALTLVLALAALAEMAIGFLGR